MKEEAGVNPFNYSLFVLFCFVLEEAFFDPSILELLYFPDDQK